MSVTIDPLLGDQQFDCPTCEDNGTKTVIDVTVKYAYEKVSYSCIECGRKSVFGQPEPSEQFYFDGLLASNVQPGINVIALQQLKTELENA